VKKCEKGKERGRDKEKWKEGEKEKERGGDKEKWLR
jgi:hypothetical protein